MPFTQHGLVLSSGMVSDGSLDVGEQTNNPLQHQFPPLDVHADEALQLQLHDRHLEMRNARNVSAPQDDYAEDAVVEGSMFSEPFVGRAALAAHIGAETVALRLAGEDDPPRRAWESGHGRVGGDWRTHW